MTTAENSVADPIDDIKLILPPHKKTAFEKWINKGTHPKGCWEWMSTRHRKGYGSFKIGKKTCKTHRISYRNYIGPLSPTIKVCHTCDNPPCCNPAHLFLGTDKDNSDDKIAKGRDRKASPENNGGGGKLTWDKVREIRRLRAEGLSQQAIANKYGVSQPMIGLIVRNEKWIEL